MPLLGASTPAQAGIVYRYDDVGRLVRVIISFAPAAIRAP